MSIPALNTLAEAEAALAAHFKAGTIDATELAEGLSAAYQAAFGGASTPLEAAVLAQQAISRLTAFVDEFLGNVGLKPGVLDDEEDLPTTGNAVGDSFVIDSNLWVWAGSTDGWQNAGPIVGPAGKSVDLRKSSTHVQWRLVGAADWIDLIALADLKGADGQEVELRANSTHIQWRLGDGEWSNLIALSVLKGADGREVEFNKTSTHLQWRYVGAADWTNLLALADVTPEAIPGPAAWTPVLANVADGERRVQRIVDWTGGEGTKPATGLYVSATGLTETIADATNMRGAAGSNGTGTGDLIAANNLSDVDDVEEARDNLQVYSKTEVDTALSGKQASLGFTPATATSVEELTDRVEVLEDAPQPILTINGESPDEDGNLELSIEASGGAMQGDIVRLVMAIAELKANQFGTANGLADAFSDDDGVDAAGSTGEVYDAVGDLYKNLIVPASSGGNLIPPQTANGAASAKSDNGTGFQAWKAMDGTSSSYWASLSGAALPQWIQFDIGSPTPALEYAISNNNPNNFAPKTFTLQGSNDGVSFVDIDQRTNEPAWGQPERRVYAIASPGSYQYYRLAITQVGGGAFAAVNELEILSVASSEVVNAMDLRSVAYTAAAAPSKASVMVVAKGASAITPGTHLKAYASRNGGTTWTEGTLVARETLSGGWVVYEAFGFDLSGASGTSMKWRVLTTDLFSVEVTGVYLGWN